MKLMLHYVGKYKKYIFLSVVCALGFALIELGLPTLLAIIIDKGVIPKDFGVVKRMTLMMFLLCLAGLIGLCGLSYVGAKINSLVMRDIRNDIFRKVQDYSHYEYGKFGAASLNTRTTNDVFKIMSFLQMTLRIGIVAPLMFIASIVMIIRTSPSLAWGLLGAVLPIVIGVIIIGKFADPLSTKQQLGLDSINMKFKESLSGIRVIRAFNKEEFQKERFNEVNEAYMNVSRKLFKLMGFAQPGFLFIFNLVFAFVIWFGAKLVGSGSLEVGNLVAFVEYIFHAMYSTMLFATVFIMYPLAAVSAGRVQEVLDCESQIVESDIKNKVDTKGVIEFRNVSFTYPGETEERVLKDISFKASPGETVAFIGSTGSGKTSIIQLIPRFYDSSSGEILIDGINVKDYNLKDLREKIGYVPQKALLFTGTIKDNLCYGKENTTLEELEYAAKISQSYDFIKDKEDGFDTFLAEGGNNLSGGQKQRLCIARAVIRKPNIYIFDDSFSALDYKTDARLREALKKETENATVLIVAQRVGTIRNADRIMVVNNGRIVASGTHKELLKNSDVYYDIASSQLSREELIRDEK